jgi:chromate transporter
VAGVCFIAPAVLIVGALAALYARFGALPQAQAVLHGVKPVVIAIVSVALWKLSRAAIKVPWHAGLAIAAVIATAAGMNELALLAACGALAGVVSAGIRRTLTRMSAFLWVPVAAGAALPAAAGVSMSGLFFVFLKAGGLLFGSGYVLLAFLRADLVERLHWLTAPQLLDAIAIGQVTPGPVFTTATFIGYQLGGAEGAAVATLAIFLPAFVFVAVSGPLIPRLRRSVIATSVLDGVNIASLALMAVVTWQLGRSALTDATSAAIAVASLVTLVGSRINPTWLIGAGIVIGLWRFL